MIKYYFLALQLALTACGGYEDEQQNETSSSEEKKWWQDEDKDEVEEEKEEKPFQDQIAPDWTLTDIGYERNYCTDDFYDYLGDDVYDFCDCLIEKVAMRWTREYWYRYNYTLKKRLAANNTMRRCAVPVEYFDSPETEEDLTEDRLFDAAEAKDDGKSLSDSIEKAVKKDDNKE